VNSNSPLSSSSTLPPYTSRSVSRVTVAHNTNIQTHTSEFLPLPYFEVWRDSPYFPDLLKYMTSGPVVAVVWQGLAAVKTGRAILCETDLLVSSPGFHSLFNSDWPLEDACRAPEPQVLSEATLHSRLAVPSATVPTRLRMPRRRSNCGSLRFSSLVLRGADQYSAFISFPCSWFPEGVVQYEATLASWIFEWMGGMEATCPCAHQQTPKHEQKQTFFQSTLQCGALPSTSGLSSDVDIKGPWLGSCVCKSSSYASGQDSFRSGKVRVLEKAAFNNTA
jgi:hypothetical protein